MAMKATVTVFLFLSLFGLNTSFYRKHYYVNSLMNWTDAQQYCRNNYDDLSRMSYEEMQVLSNNTLITSSYWIGLYRDANDPNLWRWSGGGTVTSANAIWEPGQPDTQTQQCAAVRKTTSKVYDSECFLIPKPFYCMSYELIVMPQESTWEEALLYCRQNYIDLAILNSDELMTEANEITQALTDDVWIGLRFLAGHWFWVNGEDIGDKFWSAGEELQCPAMDQRCGVYDRTQNIWKPTDCERRLNFLCVKKPWN